MIGFLHIGIANATKCPEFELSPAESNNLASATAKVLEQFDMKPDPRITAVVGLITTAGTIYVPRYYLIQMRKEKERAEKRASAPAPIPPISNGQDNTGIDPSAYNLGG